MAQNGSSWRKSCVDSPDPAAHDKALVVPSLPNLRLKLLLPSPCLFVSLILFSSALNPLSFFHYIFFSTFDPTYISSCLLWVSSTSSPHVIPSPSLPPVVLQNIPSIHQCHHHHPTPSCLRRPDQWGRWSGWIQGSGLVRRSGGERLWLVKQFLHFPVWSDKPPGVPGGWGTQSFRSNLGGSGGGWRGEGWRRG